MSRELSTRPLWSTRIYLAVSIIYILTTSVAIIITEKNNLHLYLNDLPRTEWMDFFFRYWTEVGAGTINAIICILAAFSFTRAKRPAVITMGLLSLALCGVFAALFKQVLFADVMRPAGVFPEGSLELVEGVKLAYRHSFPSGHTMVGFAFFAHIAYLYHEHRGWQFWCGIGAILVGLSRVYLSFHFLEDTIAGAVLGVLCWLLAFTLVKNVLSKIFPNLVF